MSHDRDSLADEDTGNELPSDGDIGDSAGGDAELIERAFTCSACGFPMTYEVGRLRAAVEGVCHNCGDWSTQTAGVTELIDAARGVAVDLAGEILTERQALAYLLRERVGIERQRAAEAMDTSPSNLDNLHRRGREKVEDAGRIVGELETLREPE